jgi:hypothetical protein
LSGGTGEADPGAFGNAPGFGGQANVGSFPAISLGGFAGTGADPGLQAGGPAGGMGQQGAAGALDANASAVADSLGAPSDDPWGGYNATGVGEMANAALAAALGGQTSVSTSTGTPSAIGAPGADAISALGQPGTLAASLGINDIGGPPAPAAPAPASTSSASPDVTGTSLGNALAAQATANNQGQLGAALGINDIGTSPTLGQSLGIDDVGPAAAALQSGNAVDAAALSPTSLAFNGQGGLTGGVGPADPGAFTDADFYPTMFMGTTGVETPGEPGPPGSAAPGAPAAGEPSTPAGIDLSNLQVNALGAPGPAPTAVPDQSGLGGANKILGAGGGGGAVLRQGGGGILSPGPPGAIELGGAGAIPDFANRLPPAEIAQLQQEQDQLLTQWSQVIPMTDPRWPAVVAQVQSQVWGQAAGMT